MAVVPEAWVGAVTGLGTRVGGGGGGGSSGEGSGVGGKGLGSRAAYKGWQAVRVAVAKRQQGAQVAGSAALLGRTRW